MLSIHPEIFDQKRKEIFDSLAGVKQYGYLAGGTALALQIAHRKSYDFDIFTYHPIDDALRKAVKQTFPIEKYYLDTTDQLTFAHKNGIELTFVWFDYPRIELPVTTDGIDLASIIDISANKTQTLARRAQWRDYVDLFWILKHELLTLEQIVVAAGNKYGKEFIQTQFLEQLIYFKDIEITPIEYISLSYSPDEIQQYLQSEIHRYLNTSGLP